jgi:hypothetical protein
MNTTPPIPPQKDTFIPPGGVAYHVTLRDSWVSLATGLGIDPWELIDFNFPGMRPINVFNHELATRYVNWYLSEFVGCTISRDGGKNFAFSDGQTGGRGVHRGGVIFLPPRRPPPPPPPPPPPRQCDGIDIGPSDISPDATDLLNFFSKLSGSSLPPTKFHARCLDPMELIPAKMAYAQSLDYDAIFVSPLSGAQNRPFTVAAKINNRWVVVMNMGSMFSSPGSRPDILVHELAHAWQSQHHSNPQQFMVNSVISQASSSANNASRSLSGLLDKLGQPTITMPETSAYAFVPGKSFGEYAAEQIAQQVQDFYYPPPSLGPAVRNQIWAIPQHMRNIGRGVIDSDNIRSLSTPRAQERGVPGVIWH